MGKIKKRSWVELGAYLGDEIVAARANRYMNEVWGDRFDGTPNFDDYRGAEDALRKTAQEFNLLVPTHDETEKMAIYMLRREEASDVALMEHLDCIVEGVIDD